MIGRRLTRGALFVTALGASGSALAQTASQITPPSFAPPVSTTSPVVIVPQGEGPTAPEGSEALEVMLGDIALEGGTAPAGALAQLRERLIGRSITVAEIFAAAQALEARFARDGRVLVRVVVPPQSLSNGATLRLIIIDGFIERIDTGTLPGRVRDRIAATLAPLAGARDVTLADIERRLLLAADVPGVSLRSALAAGSAPGASVLVVEADHRPVSGFVTLDNMLSQPLGRYTLGVGIDLNSVLGAGETIYLRASGYPGNGHQRDIFDATPRNRALAAGLVVPIGNDGLTFNVEGTDARTAPRQDAGYPGFGSRFRRLSGRLQYPIVRTRALTVLAQAALDAQDERVRIISPVILPISLDRLRVARVSGSVRSANEDGAFAFLRAEASFGLDALGARSAADASPTLPLSRAGADAEFQKLEVDASLDQPLAEHVRATVRLRAQTAFGQVLSNSEQIGIATSDGLSPLPSGTLQGDSGYVARAELRMPFPLVAQGLFGQIAPYGFGAYGTVRYEQPTFFERQTTDAHAYGAGLRLSGGLAESAYGMSASVEVGRGNVEGPGGRTNRFSFTLATQF